MDIRANKKKPKKHEGWRWGGSRKGPLDHGGQLRPSLLQAGTKSSSSGTKTSTGNRNQPVTGRKTLGTRQRHVLTRTLVCQFFKAFYWQFPLLTYSRPHLSSSRNSGSYASDPHPQNNAITFSTPDAETSKTVLLSVTGGCGAPRTRCGPRWPPARGLQHWH